MTYTAANSAAGVVAVSMSGTILTTVGVADGTATALASREQALPMLLATALPPAFGLRGLAAVFSAEVSSADAGRFMLLTLLSKDLYTSVTDLELAKAALWDRSSGHLSVSSQAASSDRHPDDDL